MQPQDFRPIYDDSVLGTMPIAGPGAFWHVNPMYCLGMPSARILSQILREAGYDNTLEENAPQLPSYGLVFSHLVPWLIFKGATPEGVSIEGTMRNAALLASYWGMAGVRFEQALPLAATDILTPVGV